MYTINTIKAEITKRISMENSREIDFSNATMEQKIATLKSLGGKIEDEKTYKVSRNFEMAENESKEQFAEKIKAVASIADIMAVMNGTKKAVSVTTEVKGKNLSQKQMISVLSEQVKTDGQKVKVDILGGSNFVSLLKYVREMNEEEFTKLISTK